MAALKVGDRIYTVETAEKRGYIYSLSSSEDLRPRYIGQTVSPHARHASHVTEAKSQGLNFNVSDKTKWARSVLDAGHEVVMEILAVCDYVDLDREERRAILAHRAAAFDILNASTPPDADKAGDGRPAPKAVRVSRKQMASDGYRRSLFAMSEVMTQ